MKDLPVLLLCLGLALGSFKSSKGGPRRGPPRVTTPLGDIEGAILRSRLGRPIFAFRGIRYAKPPVGELRFKPPVPVDGWDDTLNATVDGFSCPQPFQDLVNNPVSEDCLILNVYSTKLPRGGENPKRPVIVYLHSGGFYSVTSVSYWTGPQYFMDQDIVLVTVNYRLGSLGFISTGDREAPGNNGLKDQVEALKFVKSNIASFGGDPDSITICGYSAGAFSVSLHMLSPMSQGLFHKAIIMSGSIYGQYPIEKGQFHLAQKQAQLVGCPDDTSANIIRCLKTKSAVELGNSLLGFFEFGWNPTLLWTPVIEENYGQPRFLTEHPIKLVTRGQFAKVPVLTGVVSNEFADKPFMILGNETLRASLDEQFEKYAPVCFQYERDTDNSRNISRALRKFYFGNRAIDNSTLTNLAEIYGDALIGFGVNRGAKLLAERNDQPVYYYKFSYQGRYSHFYLPESNGTVPYGVVHHDDLIYLFYISRLFPWFTPSDPEAQTVEKLTKLWANFARTGKPIPEPCDEFNNVEWEPFTNDDKRYVDIGRKLVPNVDLFEERYQEWEKLFPLSQYLHAS